MNSSRRGSATHIYPFFESGGCLIIDSLSLCTGLGIPYTNSLYKWKLKCSLVWSFDTCATHRKTTIQSCTLSCSDIYIRIHTICTIPGKTKLTNSRDDTWIHSSSIDKRYSRVHILNSRVSAERHKFPFFTYLSIRQYQSEAFPHQYLDTTKPKTLPGPNIWAARQKASAKNCNHSASGRSLISILTISGQAEALRAPQEQTIIFSTAPHRKLILPCEA